MGDSFDEDEGRLMIDDAALDNALIAQNSETGTKSFEGAVECTAASEDGDFLRQIFADYSDFERIQVKKALTEGYKFTITTWGEVKQYIWPSRSSLRIIIEFREQYTIYQIMTEREVYIT